MCLYPGLCIRRYFFSGNISPIQQNLANLLSSRSRARHNAPGVHSPDTPTDTRRERVSHRATAALRPARVSFRLYSKYPSLTSFRHSPDRPYNISKIATGFSPRPLFRPSLRSYVPRVDPVTARCRCTRDIDEPNTIFPSSVSLVHFPPLALPPSSPPLPHLSSNRRGVALHLPPPQSSSSFFERRISGALYMHHHHFRGIPSPPLPPIPISRFSYLRRTSTYIGISHSCRIAHRCPRRGSVPPRCALSRFQVEVFGAIGLERRASE